MASTLRALMPRWLRRIRPLHVPADAAPAGTAANPDNDTATAIPSGSIEAERQRIYRDLHDDIGARLLTILHTASEPSVQELARQALLDLREVVYHARGEAGSLEHVFGEIRHELSERLALAGWTLQWEQGVMPAEVLSGDRSLHLYRIVREAATNALKHGVTRTLRVRTRHLDGIVFIEITDQGERWDLPSAAGRTPGTGSGMAGMHTRAARLGGELSLEAATLQGTKVLLKFPLSPMGHPTLQRP